MEKLVGPRVRAIGVSNFTIHHLEKLLKTAKIVPAVLQVELHPHFPQWDLVNYCAKHNIHGILTEACSCGDNEALRHLLDLLQWLHTLLLEAQPLLLWKMEQ